MPRALSVVALLLALAGIAWAEPPQPPPAKVDGPLVFHLVVRAASGPQPRALKVGLLPDYLERVPGNAAPLWLRAGEAALLTRPELTEQDQELASRPLKDLPRQGLQKLLARFQRALHFADQAALRDHCDWERPPLTVQTLEDLPLTEIQSSRELARLLYIRARLEMAEGHPDRALHSLQVGMALARDIGNGPTLIDSLVGIAIESIMLGQTWELLEQPGVPNLYWGATMLPRPFVDLRRMMESELAILDRSYPALRGLENGNLSGAGARTIVEDLLRRLGQSGKPSGPTAKEIPDLATLTRKDHEKAVGYLLAHGYKAEQVNAMGAEEAVALHLLAQYDEDRDDLLKWFAVPLREGRRGVEEVGKRVEEHPERSALIRPQLAGMTKTVEAGLRLEREIATTRCAEAIRLYAADHDGRLPKALPDITEVPLPIDPYTGKGYDEYYRGDEDHAVLDVPPPPAPPNMPLSLGRRFEFTRAR